MMVTGGIEKKAVLLPTCKAAKGYDRLGIPVWQAHSPLAVIKDITASVITPSPITPH
jgi:hypothetical protein